MRKLKLAKAEVLENIDSFQPSIILEQEAAKKEACLYKINQVLSDVPIGAASGSCPYALVSGKAVPHPVFDLLKISILSKEEADLLFATEVGFDQKIGFPCLIVKNNGVVQSIVYPQDKSLYIMDCFTGLEKERK